MRLLLLDGHPAIRKAMMDVMPAAVPIAIDLIPMQRADAAAARLRAEAFDVVVVDTLNRCFPLDETVRMLREADSQVAIMLMTAAPASCEVVQAIEAGGCAVFDTTRGIQGFWQAILECVPDAAIGRSLATEPVEPQREAAE